jgi:high affinity sulfate transporter 1
VAEPSRGQTVETRDLARYLPILAWAPKYDRAWLTRDAIAGLTVWALVVPEAIAYAALAGVPVQYGLYSVPLAMLAYAVFGSSRELFVGPSSSVAAMSGVAVGTVASGSDPAEAVVLSATLALMIGVILIALGIARMGFVSRFFAKPVLDGFIVGLGLWVSVSQFPKLVGVEKPSGNSVEIFAKTLGDIGDWPWETVAVGFVSLGALFALSRFMPKVPGALLVAAVALAIVPALDLEEHGVHVVGTLPSGFDFVPWTGVGWGELGGLVPGAFAIVVVGFAQSLAVAKAFSVKAGYRIDPNQELIGYGAANLGAGVLQGFTGTGSVSKTAAAQEAGGKTPVLLLIGSVATLLTIFFLAGFFENLPEATLAAIVIHAVSGMMDFPKLARLWRVHPNEFVLAAGALLGVILIDIFPGVLIGVALSFVMLIRRLDHPTVTLLGRSRDGSEFRNVATGEGTPVPGALIYRFEAPLIFANAEVFSDGVLDAVAVADRPLEAVILDFGPVSDVDSTGSQALLEVKGALDERGVDLYVVRATGAVRELMRRDGVVSGVGEDRFFRTLADAVAAFDGSAGPPAADEEARS